MNWECVVAFTEFHNNRMMSRSRSSCCMIGTILVSPRESSIFDQNKASSAVGRRMFRLARKEYCFSESSVRVILRCQSAGARYAG